MLKSILVTTANGKPQTASSRLPFAVNAMLKVPINFNLRAIGDEAVAIERSTAPMDNTAHALNGPPCKKKVNVRKQRKCPFNAR